MDDFVWDGPHFKPKDRYLTNEGYPIGTTCWYVRIEMHGYTTKCCRDTKLECLIAAIMFIQRDKDEKREWLAWEQKKAHERLFGKVTKK